MPINFRDQQLLYQLLTQFAGVADESGISFGGTTTTLLDPNKNWPVNHWAGAPVYIFHMGPLALPPIPGLISPSWTMYLRTIISNTANTLTFAAIPVAVAMMDRYAIKRSSTFPTYPKATTTLLNMALIAAAARSTLLNCAALPLLTWPATLTLTVKARYNAAAVAGIRVHIVSSPNNQATGTHTAANHATIMTDAAAHFVANELVGLTINNTSDGSSGVITANTETTVTVAALAGGTLNIWTTGNAYSITGCNYDNYDFDTWVAGFVAGGVLRQTKTYDTSPVYLKAIIENLDAAQAVTDVQVIASKGS